MRAPAKAEGNGILSMNAEPLNERRSLTALQCRRACAPASCAVRVPINIRVKAAAAATRVCFTVSVYSSVSDPSRAGTNIRCVLRVVGVRAQNMRRACAPSKHPNNIGHRARTFGRRCTFVLCTGVPAILRCRRRCKGHVTVAELSVSTTATTFLITPRETRTRDDTSPEI